MSRNHVNELAAEYGFVYMFFQGGNTPVYIGKTIDPVKRLAMHFRTKQSAIKGIEEMKNIGLIKIAHVGDGRDAIALEAGLIFKYSPILNSQIGSRIPIKRMKFNEGDYEWASFTPSEFLQDYTIIYRCLSRKGIA